MRAREDRQSNRAPSQCMPADLPVSSASNRDQWMAYQADEQHDDIVRPARTISDDAFAKYATIDRGRRKQQKNAEGRRRCEIKRNVPSFFLVDINRLWPGRLFRRAFGFARWSSMSVLPR